MPDRNASCPCGSGRKTKRCCLPVVEGTALAADPIALLRARFCAYGWGAVPFLIASGNTTDAEGLAAYCAVVRTIRLEVHEATVDGDAGEVRYTARLEVRGQPVVLRERARYAREGGRWRYTGGDLE